MGDIEGPAQRQVEVVQHVAIDELDAEEMASRNPVRPSGVRAHHADLLLRAEGVEHDLIVRQRAPVVSRLCFGGCSFVVVGSGTSKARRACTGKSCNRRENPHGRCVGQKCQC